MKKLFIIVCLDMMFFSCSTIASVNSNEKMEQINTKENSLLNEREGASLNRIFETTRKDFDFVNKKNVFLTGSSAAIKSSKEDYFDMQEKHLSNESFPCDNGSLYIFNAGQKEASGGYDGAIVYWTKFAVPIETIINKLNKKR